MKFWIRIRNSKTNFSRIFCFTTPSIQDSQLTRELFSCLLSWKIYINLRLLFGRLIVNKCIFAESIVLSIFTNWLNFRSLNKLNKIIGKKTLLVFNLKVLIILQLFYKKNDSKKLMITRHKLYFSDKFNGNLLYFKHWLNDCFICFFQVKVNIG